MTAPTGRPRVWPVFVAFAVASVALQIVSAVAFSAWAYATMARAGGANAFVARLEDLAASPPGLAVAALISATGLGAAALGGAAMSPEPWRRRLRLSTAGITAGRIALVVIGVLAVSQALDSGVALLGLSRYGTLDHIDRVLARASLPWLAVLTLAVALGPGVAEEMFFRGFMQTRLAQRFDSAIAIGAAAACFGLVHFDLVHTPVAALLGVFLGWAAERTGTIVPGMVAHVVNNLIAVLTARFTLDQSRGVALIVLAGTLSVAALCVWSLRRSYRLPPPGA